jgi:hypothetical protein
LHYEQERPRLFDLGVPYRWNRLLKGKSDGLFIFFDRFIGKFRLYEACSCCIPLTQTRLLSSEYRFFRCFSIKHYIGKGQLYGLCKTAFRKLLPGCSAILIMREGVA